MLKKRIIPIQLLVNERLVKTVQFDSFRDVGNPVASSKVYSNQDADELVFLNINRENRTLQPLLSLIEKVSKVCFMPLALGGGIRKLADVEQLIRNGADKVVINSAAYDTPDLLREASAKFGSQAIMLSVDARLNKETKAYELYSDCGRKKENGSLADHIKRSLDHGAGEILINSIDRDGTMTGYDVELIHQVKALSTVPVIGCGGAGDFSHLKDAFLSTGADALACGSLFNFGDNNPIRAKAFLSNHGLHFKVV